MYTRAFNKLGLGIISKDVQKKLYVKCAPRWSVRGLCWGLRHYLPCLYNTKVSVTLGRYRYNDVKRRHNDRRKRHDDMLNKITYSRIDM